MCDIYSFPLIYFIYIYTWQRLSIPTRSAGTGACDKVGIVQRNPVLCMVLLQKKDK